MIAICIESSPQRGMGHFYRAINIFEYFGKMGDESMIIINSDKASEQILKERGIPFAIADYTDTESNWEKEFISRYQINVWILDKFQTKAELAMHVKKTGIILAAIDDSGDGAELVDLHFCSMLFRDLKGKNVYVGKDYLILNPDIAKYRRKREHLQKILVTMGGSDTYGVTVEVVKLLKKYGYNADIVIGPNFQFKSLLDKEITSQFTVYETVPSLIAKFYEYDLAITGGGVTCFEANASGLPCIIIANEKHEIDIAEYITKFQGAKFAGYYKEIDENILDISRLDVREMSCAALQAIPLNGIENVYKRIKEYSEK